MKSDSYRYDSNIYYHFDLTKVIKDNTTLGNSNLNFNNNIINYQKQQSPLNYHMHKNTFQKPVNNVHSTTNLKNHDLLNFSQTDIPMNLNKTNNYCSINNLPKETFLNRNSINNNNNNIKKSNITGTDYKKAPQKLNMIKLDINVKNFDSPINYSSKKNYLNNRNALQNNKINYLLENSNQKEEAINRNNRTVQYNMKKTSKGKIERNFKTKKDMSISNIKENTINDDKNNFMQNIEDIQDLDDIEIDNNINNKVYRRINYRINLKNNFIGKSGKNNELIIKNNNMNQNIKNNCCITSRTNQSKIVNNSSINTKKDIINQKNDIPNQKVQNYPNQINSTNPNKSVQINKTSQNLFNNTNMLDYTNMNDSDIKNNFNVKNKNFKKNLSSQNFTIKNTNQKHYSTISNDQNFKNIRHNFNKPPRSNEIIIDSKQFTLNNTNYLDESNNNIINKKIINNNYSEEYINLLNDYLKMKKTIEKLEKEIENKNNYIQDLQNLNKQNVDLINFQNQLIDDAKKKENNYISQIKTLNNEKFLLRKENWEIKNSEGGTISSKRQINELQEKIEKYKIENNKLKIIIIRTKNNNQKSTGNETKYRLSGSFNLSSEEKEYEEKKRIKYNSMNHGDREWRNAFRNNSLFKGKKKRGSIQINKNFKEDMEEVGDNSFKRSFG